MADGANHGTRTAVEAVITGVKASAATAFAETENADFRGSALHAATSAIVWVRRRIDADPPATYKGEYAGRLLDARPIETDRRRLGAHIAAGAAVVGVGIEEGAATVAVHGSFDAVVNA